ncbi:MAG: hypothetical protein ACLUVV_01170 [Christensenellales bacterium]
MASNKQRQKTAYRQTCQKLTGEHRDVMKAMEAYIKNSELKKEEVFSICRKLAEKLYRAQRQGQTVEQALGKDLIGVCDVYIHLGAKKSGGKADGNPGRMPNRTFGPGVDRAVLYGHCTGVAGFCDQNADHAGIVISSVLILGFAWA